MGCVIQLLVVAFLTAPAPALAQAPSFEARAAEVARQVNAREEVYLAYRRESSSSRMGTAWRTAVEQVGASSLLIRQYQLYIRLARNALEQAREAHRLGDSERAEERLAYATRLESIGLERLWRHVLEHNERGRVMVPVMGAAGVGLAACGLVATGGAPLVVAGGAGATAEGGGGVWLATLGSSVALHAGAYLAGEPSDPEPSADAGSASPPLTQGSSSAPATEASERPAQTSTPPRASGHPEATRRPRWRRSERERQLRAREARLVAEFRSLLREAVTPLTSTLQPAGTSAVAAARSGPASGIDTVRETLAVAEDAGILARAEEVSPPEGAEGTDGEVGEGANEATAAERSVASRFAASLEDLPEPPRTREELIAFARAALRASMSDGGQVPSDFGWTAFLLDRDALSASPSLDSARRRRYLSTWDQRVVETVGQAGPGHAGADAVAETLVRYYLGMESPRVGTLLETFAGRGASTRQQRELMLGSLQRLKGRLGPSEVLGVQLVAGRWRTVVIRVSPPSIYDPLTGTSESSVTAPVYAPAALLHSFLSEQGALGEGERDITLERLTLLAPPGAPQAASLATITASAAPATPAPASPAPRASPTPGGVPRIDGMPVLWGGGDPLAPALVHERDPEAAAPTQVRMGARTETSGPGEIVTGSSVSLSEEQLEALRTGLQALGMLPRLLDQIPSGVDIMELMRTALAAARASGMSLSELGSLEHLQEGLMALGQSDPELLRDVLPLLQRLRDSGSLAPFLIAARSLGRLLESGELAPELLERAQAGDLAAVSQIAEALQRNGVTLRPELLSAVFELRGLAANHAPTLRRLLSYIGFGAGEAGTQRVRMRRTARGDEVPNCFSHEQLVTRSFSRRGSARVLPLPEMASGILNLLGTTRPQIRDIVEDELLIPASLSCSPSEIAELQAQAARRIEAALLEEHSARIDFWLPTGPAALTAVPSEAIQSALSGSRADLGEDRGPNYRIDLMARQFCAALLDVYQMESLTNPEVRTEEGFELHLVDPLSDAQERQRRSQGQIFYWRSARSLQECERNSLFSALFNTHVRRWSQAIADQPEAFLAFYNQLDDDHAAYLNRTVLQQLRLSQLPEAGQALEALRMALDDPTRVEVAGRRPLYVPEVAPDAGSEASRRRRGAAPVQGSPATQSEGQRPSPTGDQPLPATPFTIEFVIAPRPAVAPRAEVPARPRVEAQRRRVRRGAPTEHASAIRLSPARFAGIAYALARNPRSTEAVQVPSTTTLARRWRPGGLAGISPWDRLPFVVSNMRWLLERETGNVRWSCASSRPGSTSETHSSSPELARALRELLEGNGNARWALPPDESASCSRELERALREAGHPLQAPTDP
jgi:hypothetical protein